MNEIENSTLEPIDPQSRRYAWVEIDERAIRNNYVAIRNFIKPSVKMCCAVKANAYGHGSVECAKIYESMSADYLAVATVDEGVELRKAGIKTSIILLQQPPVSAIPLLLEYDIEPSLYDIQYIIQYAEIADRRGVSAPFHLAVNTGMNRIGVNYSDIGEFAAMFMFHRSIELKGTFTHFATADSIDDLDFRKQVTRFESAIQQLRDRDIDPGIVHAANSAALLKYPEVHFDMVRPGIILYGQRPSVDFRMPIKLNMAMSVRARVTDVRNVPIGEGVSYGLVYRSRGCTRVCTIPIGYADGLHRSASGKINVIINGEKHPQVGRICMDQCMFEVAQRTLSRRPVKDPLPGDIVTLIGEQEGEFIMMDDLAEAALTINYELCCSLGNSRLEHVYV